MDRTRSVARSLLPTAAVLAAALGLATLPATHDSVNAGTAAQRHLLDDEPPEVGKGSARPPEAGSGSIEPPEAGGGPAAPPTKPEPVARAAPELLAKAAPDECFGGNGPPRRPGSRCEVGEPKVNQSYVWGLTKSGNHVWFGTAANVYCLASGLGLAQTEPMLNDDYVCEYGESPQREKNPIIPPSGGDWRPPNVFLYDTKTRKLTDKTQAISKKSAIDKLRLESTVGIRAAGSHQGVVLFGGPSALGINLFAFDDKSGRYLGSTTIAAYGSIRHFVVADGALYTGVGVGPDGLAGGAVLRWTGRKSSPFKFMVVGKVPAQVADLTAHKGRLFLTTWPSIGRGIQHQTIGGVWMSPRLAAGKRGLSTADAKSWKQVWNVSQYEPDPVVAVTYGLGGLASYGGHLYWGTMNVPLKATRTHTTRHRPAGNEQALSSVKNTQRTASLFRAGNLDKRKPSVELLYGEAELPAFNPRANNGAGQWQLTPTGYKPKFGASGFGNSYNNYIWKMVVAGGSLYIGTMDWSYISEDLPATLDDAVQAGIGTADPTSYGADLWVFDNPRKPAKPVSTSGLGNYLNYGVRTMVADRSALYLGMANPMNLRTDKSDDVPEGGWELIRLPVTKSHPATPKG